MVLTDFDLDPLPPKIRYIKIPIKTSTKWLRASCCKQFIRYWYKFQCLLFGHIKDISEPKIRFTLCVRCSKDLRDWL